MEKNKVIHIKEELKTEDVTTTSRNVKALQFRENRIQITDTTMSTVEILDSNRQKISGRILDISRFGARVVIDANESVLFGGAQRLTAQLSLKKQIVFEGHVLVVNEFKRDNQKITFGLAFEGQGIDPDQITAILEMDISTTNLNSSKKLLEISELVKSSFKVLVADLNTLFQDLKMRLTEESEKIRDSAKSDNHRMRLEEHVIKLALSLYVEDIHNLFKKFKDITDTLNFDETITHKRYFRSNFHPLVLGAPFVSRGFNKPLGYAGDYGLMVMLYEYYDSGSNLFEKFFHRFSCNEPAAVANKNRVEFIASLIIDEFYRSASTLGARVFKVSSLACGPAKEIELFLNDLNEETDRHITAICIDQEERALEYAQSKIKPLTLISSKRKAQFFKEDVITSLIKSRGICTEISESHIIVCAGLFDYLSDRVASRLIDAMYSLIEPGGFLLIGNVSTENPDRFSMDYFAEWNLILRSAKQLSDLVPKQLTEIGRADVEVISESLGINLFLKVTKPHG